MTAHYSADLMNWRREYQERLLANQGWLRAAGLFWLQRGANHLDVDPSGILGITPDSDTGMGATFCLRGDVVQLRVAADTPLRIGGRLENEARFVLDENGDSAPITLGERTLVVIRRGDRFGIRSYDDGAAAYRSFAGLDWFPVDPDYRVMAHLEPYPEPKTVPIMTILGDSRDARVPGQVVFTVGGREQRLLPTLAKDRLQFVFQDGTSGQSTYPAGRFLYADPPHDNNLILDFNRATNPPCAYTPFATCPLPLPENRLALPIPAGERLYRPSVP